MKEKQTSGLSGVRVGLIAVSVAVVFALVGFIALKPDTTIPAIMNFKTSVLAFTSPFVELFAFGCFLIALYIAFGKYKNVKLGEGEPEYSTFSYVAMMFMASMASAAVYWAFTEWAFLLHGPGPGRRAGVRQGPGDRHRLPVLPLGHPQRRLFRLRPGLRLWLLYPQSGDPEK